jgi:hypothetical protein
MIRAIAGTKFQLNVLKEKIRTLLYEKTLRLEIAPEQKLLTH